MDDPGALEAPAPTVESGDVIALEDAIKRLPEGARTVLVLSEIEGYPHREIAEMEGVSLGTVKSQLHRARRLLREELGQ